MASLAMLGISLSGFPRMHEDQVDWGWHRP